MGVSFVSAVFSDTKRFCFGHLSIILLSSSALLASSPGLAGATAPMKWSISKSLPQPPTSLSDIACPTVNNCEVGGDAPIFNGDVAAMYGTTNGGAKWERQSVPKGVPGITGVACASATTCEAVSAGSSNGSILGTTNGGTSWMKQPLPSQARFAFFEGVSCPSVTICYTAGADGSAGAFILGTNNGGATWKAQSLPSGVINVLAISCPSPTTCQAVGSSSILRTTNGGASWTSQATPKQLSAVACPSLKKCEAVGGDGTSAYAYTTTNGGMSWTLRATLPAKFMSSIACASTAECEAVGQTGKAPVVLRTVNGGATWQAQKLPASKESAPALSFVSGVACPSTSTCDVSGTTPTEAVVIATNDGGTSWHHVLNAGGIDTLDGVSCASGTTTCEVVGFNNKTDDAVLLRTTNGGSSWTPQSAPEGIDVVESVSCPSVEICEALAQPEATNGGGGSGQVKVLGTTDGGTAWKVQGALPGAGRISCGSTTNCEAGSTGSMLGTTNGGTTWSTQALPNGVQGVLAVSCTSSTTCEAAGTDSQGNSVLFGTTNAGAIWTAQETTPALLSTISCGTPTTCESVGFSVQDGTDVAFGTTNGGATWQEQSTPALMFAVACASASDCQATGATGLSVDVGEAAGTTNAGGTWTAESLPRQLVSFNLSCASPQFCLSIAKTTILVGGP